jgi:hypothetical protein
LRACTNDQHAGHIREGNRTQAVVPSLSLRGQQGSGGDAGSDACGNRQFNALAWGKLGDCVAHLVAGDCRIRSAIRLRPANLNIGRYLAAQGYIVQGTRAVCIRDARISNHQRKVNLLAGVGAPPIAAETKEDVVDGGWRRGGSIG